MIRIPKSIKPFIRTAWRPITLDGDGPVTASKFSGSPWLAKDEPWPECQNCGKPMQLFLQLNLNDLPEQLRAEFGTGLLQMFYCTNSDPLCEVEGEAFSPNAKSKLLRVIKTKSQPQDSEIPHLEDYFPAKTIVEWQALDDYPNWEEGSDLGIQLTDSQWDRISDEGYPQSGDKLAGWPSWVQGVEYPSCPVCQETMQLVFQIESEEHIPYMFGDAGCGHITQCREHKEQLAFGWACC